MATVRAERVKTLVITAILSAIIVIVSFFPLKTLGLEITFSMVPVAVGAILLGARAGAFLGGVFGMVSFLQCLGYSAFGVVLLEINPVYTFIVCVPTRILVGLLTALIYKAFKNRKTLGCAVASILAPIMNTVFFMGTLVLCFYNTEYIQGFVSALGALNPIHFILLFVGINGLVEIICGAVIAFPVSKGVQTALKR